MSKKVTYGLLVLTLLCMSCTEKTEYVLNLSCNIYGEVTTRSETEGVLDDKENVFIELLGSDPLLTAYSDSAGEYLIENVPTGTYDIRVSKEGYEGYKHQGVQILGSKDQKYSIFLVEYSKTNPENLNVLFTGNDEFTVLFKINHAFDEMLSYRQPSVSLFIDSTENVSYENFVHHLFLDIKVDSGEVYSETFDISLLSIFESGQKIYLRAYGRNRYQISGYYDIDADEQVTFGYVNPSNIFSTTVP